MRALLEATNECLVWGYCITEAIPNWANLSEDVLHAIFKHLGVQDVLRCRLVCQYWKGITTQIVSSAALPKHSAGNEASSVASEMLTTFPRLKKLTIPCISATSCNNDFLNLVAIIGRVQSIQSLTIQDVPVKAKRDLVSLTVLSSLRLRHLCMKLRLDNPDLSLTGQLDLQDSIVSGVSALTSLHHLCIYALDMDSLWQELDVANDAGDPGSLASLHAPRVAPFLDLTQLTSLQLMRCLLCDDAMAELCGRLTALVDLDLSGSLRVGHRAISALSACSQLERLSLRKVRLEFDPTDPNDCPVSLMNALCATLHEHAPRCSKLEFAMDHEDHTRYIHAAYLLGLWESPLNCLTDLSLSTMVLDSDYCLHILAGLSCLTRLAIAYQTWPLSLHRDDLTCLSQLSRLEEAQLVCGDAAGRTLLALTPEVVQVLAGSWTRLRSLTYSGQILLHTPTLHQLAGWTSLTNLSLMYVNDGASPTYRILPPDETTALLELNLPASLPPHLRSLSLTNIRVSPPDMVLLGEKMPQLQQLQLVGCGLYEEQLGVSTFGLKKLEVFILSQHQLLPSFMPKHVNHLASSMHPQLIHGWWGVLRRCLWRMWRRKGARARGSAPITTSLPHQPALVDRDSPALMAALRSMSDMVNLKVLAVFVQALDLRADSLLCLSNLTTLRYLNLQCSAGAWDLESIRKLSLLTGLPALESSSAH